MMCVLKFVEVLFSSYIETALKIVLFRKDKSILIMQQEKSFIESNILFLHFQTTSTFPIQTKYFAREYVI